jgi:hypothetical protein
MSLLISSSPEHAMETLMSRVETRRPLPRQEAGAAANFDDRRFPGVSRTPDYNIMTQSMTAVVITAMTIKAPDTQNVQNLVNFSVCTLIAVSPPSFIYGSGRCDGSPSIGLYGRLP